MLNKLRKKTNFAFFALITAFSNSLFANESIHEPVLTYEFQNEFYLELSKAELAIKVYVEEETGISPELIEVESNDSSVLVYQPAFDAFTAEPHISVTPGPSENNNHTDSYDESLAYWYDSYSEITSSNCPESFLDGVISPPLIFTGWVAAGGFWDNNVLARKYESLHEAVYNYYTYENGADGQPLCELSSYSIDDLFQKYEAYECGDPGYGYALPDDELGVPKCHPVGEQSITVALACPTSHPIPVLNSAGGIQICVKQKTCPVNQPDFGLKGNPVSCETGEKLQSELIYQGGGADPLEYKTHYSSPKFYADSSEIEQPFATAQGRQRSDNLRRKISLIYDVNDVRVYEVKFRNGFNHIFYGNASETLLQSNLNISGTLTINSNGTMSQKTDRETVYNFNSSGDITSRVTRQGLTRTYQYNESGLLASVTNHFGKRLQFAYNDQNLLEEIIVPGGEVYSFEYDTYLNMTKIIYPDKTPSDLSDNPYLQFLFEDDRFPNHLTGKLNEVGVRFATWGYDDNGRAVSSEHGVNLEKVEFDYSIPFQTRTTTFLSDEISSEEIYHYQTKYIGGEPRVQLKQLEYLACSNCNVGSWYFTYDENGFINRSTSPNGQVTVFYYAGDLESRRIEAFGTSEERTMYLTYDGGGKLTSYYQSPLRKMYIRNYTTGVLLSKREIDYGDYSIRTTNYTSNNDGLPTVINGARTDVNDITTYTYDTEGNISTIKNAFNQITTFSNYDANGRIGTITDPNGIVTTLTYTPRGWLETSTTNGALTQYEYFPTGSIKQVTSPSGHVINYEYDDGERLTEIVDNDGNRIEYTRDLMGNITQNDTKDAAGVIRRTQSAVFNALGQIKQSLGNNGQSQTLTYDADGNPLTTKNAKNNTTTSNYDALNRLIKSIDPDNGETNYGYDALDNLTSVTDAEGKTTSYEYNAFGEVTKITSPDTGVTTFTYDKAGNALTKTDARNETTTYTYDALNRVLTESFSDSAENITYSYDDTSNGNKGIGRLTSVTDQSGTTSYVYNGFGQITKETRVINGKTYITEYHFDTNGQMTGITYPSGRQVNYTFDSLNRISGVTTTHNTVTSTLASSADYLPFGPMKSVSYGNGKSLTQTFDLDYRLTDKTTSGIHQVSYGYDVTDNITTITDSLDATKSQTFTYDKLSRLLSADGGYGSLGFTYDKIGNRLSKTDNNNVDTYAYATDAHRLLNITGSNANTFTHDAIGNTLTKGDLTFTYNKQGRLKSASKTGMNAEYVYNFQGQRVSKQVDGVTTHFIYDLNGQLIAEADSTGTIIKEYAYLNGQRLSVFENGATYFVHIDHLGTPIALSDSTGTVQWKAHYTPFGKAIVEVNNLTQNIRFPGQYFDSESGLHYNYFRDYDPEIGRYIQSDPIGLNGGINTYGYVLGNPIKYVDPFGLEVYTLGGEATAILGILGGKAKCGLYYDSDTFDFGIYTDLPHSAIDSAGIEFGLVATLDVTTSMNDFLGETLETGMSAGPAGIDVNIVRNRGFVGGGIDLGPSIGSSVSRVYTDTYSARKGWRDLIEFVKDKIRESCHCGE